ncbi:MAG TPA: heavy metal translocating P-type ATPase, partial [Longimicrobium sp.]|nr:heavy metal translocating P-type ATPase [Longimicrobium sp.]
MANDTMVPARAAGDKVTIPVSGMTCAACSGRVQRALEKESGVASAAVNLMTRNATVSYDPAVTTPDRLVETIRGTGYGAELARPDQTAFAEQEAQDRAQAEEFSELRRKAAVSFAVAALAMVVSMPLMSMGGHAADPFMRWTTHWLDPILRSAFPWLYRVPAAALSYGLLALTLGLMAWAGRHFYTRAWAAFRHHSADMNTLVAVGTGAAFLYSVVATVAPGFFLARGVNPDVYYEAVAFIIALILMGNALEARAKRQTSSALRALVQLQPKTARIVRDGAEADVPVDEVRAGDLV